MGKIDELIKELCPDGVEYVKLGEIAEIGTGSSNTKDGLSEGLYPFYTRGQEILRKNEYEYDEEAIVTAGDGVGVGKVIHYTKGKYALHQRAYRFKPNENLMCRFLFHYMLETFQIYICGNAVASSVVSLRKPKLIAYPIPLPPLSIQQQIVDILDTFTDSISNLQEELELREKQMEYHRERLLSFDDGNEEWKSIKDIGRITRGNGLQKKEFTDEGVGCIHYGQIYTRFGLSTDTTLTFVDSKLAKKLTKVEPGNLVIACTSENLEDVCKSVVWQGTQTIVTGGHACVLNHHENPKYIGYCFTAYSFQRQKIKHAYGAKVIDIKTEKLGEIKIPVPSLSRQQEIVDILDTFESMIANIKKEMELRQKQYEYYREKLLTFERKGA